jgi:hypothetical protein
MKRQSENGSDDATSRPSILHLPGINAPYVHVHPVSSVAFFGIPTSSLDTPQKSCDNGEKAIEDTPDDPN